MNLQTAYDLKMAQKAGEKAIEKSIVPMVLSA
jgi:plasmid maintenance system antidote protein VapI